MHLTEVSLLELKGRLLTDFIPHGAFGLTGQATLRDPSGERQVYVQVLKVSPQSKTRFRANTSVAMKGTIKRFATVSGTKAECLTAIHSHFRLCPALDRRVGNGCRL